MTWASVCRIRFRAPASTSWSRQQLVGKTHWQDSDDLAMMFQGTYTSEFYRAVRNLIHDQVTLQTVEPAGQNSPAKRALERRWHDLDQPRKPAS